MRTPFDRLAKDLLGALLEPACRTVTPEREISGEAQRLDLWCEPNPERLGELDRIVLLRRMLQDGPCGFEFFHQAPGLEQVLRSLGKVLVLRRSEDRAPTLWIIAAGRPHQVLSELPSLRPLVGWPSGTYAADPGLRLRLMVASELPRSRDTLLFRLLGARRTLRDALLDVHGLPRDDALRRTVLPIVLPLSREARESPAPEQQELVMDTQELQELQELYEKWESDLLAKGEARAVVAFLRSRGVEVPADAAARIEGTSDLATLERWLSRAATVKSVEELFEQ